MSACISRHGEYGEHTPDAEYVCTLCGVLDEATLLAELRDLRARGAEHDAQVAAKALRDAAAGLEEFAEETYARDIFIKPSSQDYVEINALLKRERGHMLDGVSADCYRRALAVGAHELRARADAMTRQADAPAADVEGGRE